MTNEECKCDHGYTLFGFIIIGIIVYLIIREIRDRTTIEELVRDSEGRIIQIITKKI